MQLSEIMQNPHFNQIAAIFAVSMAPGWRMTHLGFPSVLASLERLTRLAKSAAISTPIKQDLVQAFTSLMINLVEEDPKLFYRVEDLNWLTKIIDGPDVALILSMLFAVASTRQDWLTVEQVSDLLGENAKPFTGPALSTLRRDAAEGRIIGAKKLAKTWLFNGLALRAYGLEVPTPISVEIEQSDSDNHIG